MLSYSANEPMQEEVDHYDHKVVAVATKVPSHGFVEDLTTSLREAFCSEREELVRGERCLLREGEGEGKKGN